jgi:hypothetical protein
MTPKDSLSSTKQGEELSIPANGLEAALPIALQKNQEALNSISRLYARVSDSDDPTLEFGHLVNRVTRIRDGSPIPLPLMSEVGPPEQMDQSTNYEIGMPPVWQVTLSAAKEIFERVLGQNASAAELVWAASSIEPPPSRSEDEERPIGMADLSMSFAEFPDRSPLGFDDVVILHSNRQEVRSGKRILQDAESVGFLSLSRVFFPALAAAQKDGVSPEDKEILMRSDFGIWICPTENPRVPKAVQHILKVECNRSSLPPAIPEPKDLLQHTYQFWRERYVKFGNLEPYFAAFDTLAGKGAGNKMNLLFCPVLYVDQNDQTAAGANISLGIIGDLKQEQVHEILMCLKALQAGLASTTAGFSQAHVRIRELHRSHQMLLLLQRPLDNLTKAFNSVQSEAQEMQSVLNAPEVALFRSHKLLTDLFTQDREIKVSKTLTLRAAHSWSGGNVKTTDQVRMAYAYAICRIFGKEGELQDCQNVDSVEATAQQVLHLVHAGGAHSRLLTLLSRLLIAKSKDQYRVFELIKSPGELQGEDKEKAAERKARSLDEVLKSVVFTPFKSFGKTWPTRAFEVAFLGDRYEYSDSAEWLQVDPSITPFAQNAILEFITSFCALTNKVNPSPWKDIKFRSLEQSVEIRLNYSGPPPYDPSHEGERSSLPEYLAHAIQHRDDLGNSGNFLNCFGALMRKGLGVARGKAKQGEWTILECDPETTMIRLGKAGSQNAENTATEYERIFEIRQERAADRGTVVISWSEYGEGRLKNLDSNREGDSMSSEEVRPNSGKLTGLKCALLDHKNKPAWRDQWTELLTSLEMSLVGTNEDWEDASILLLHQNVEVKETIATFLDGNSARKVILISTTGDPHPEARDALIAEFRDRIRVFENGGYKLTSNFAKELLRKCLGAE